MVEFFLLALLVYWEVRRRTKVCVCDKQVQTEVPWLYYSELLAEPRGSEMDLSSVASDGFDMSLDGMSLDSMSILSDCDVL
jgi:hypothetical protein